MTPREDRSRANPPERRVDPLERRMDPPERRMDPLERRYRRLLLAYPRAYRAAHGSELLGVLLDCAAPGRTVPEAGQVAGLLAGGLRERVRHAARGDAWRDGLHLGVSAVMAVQLAVLLPFAGQLPLWVALSALAFVAVLRGRVRVALPLAAAVAAKSVALASGWQPFDVTILPIYPDFLADRPLYADGGPGSVLLGHGVVLLGLAILSIKGVTRARSWWWCAAVPLAAWTGPGWMADGTPYPIGLGRMALELTALASAAWAARLTRDPRWAPAAALYLAATSAQLVEHLGELTHQHLAYWGLLAVMTAAPALLPLGRRRRVPD
ncbi:hypothetical protein HII36_20035 [Nonomuraea sp. NN258]|uniref:hypothetical protein n=1 Tax=Nonomuraea antri TaxID=2730852 RepID=UPI001569BDE1|nr:hypothetical protein [Nonomuraea antri]NRQ34125.1 hypothetical protein [Nonomuraea antri]